MKNRKGFTLVEILAVIVLLSLLIIIAVPTVLDALQGGKTGLDKINKRNLTDACESVILEVVTCKMHDSTFEALNVTQPSNSAERCNTLKEAVLDQTVNTTVQKLVDAGYFQDDGHVCTGNIKITTRSSDYKVTVNLENVKCSK